MAGVLVLIDRITGGGTTLASTPLQLATSNNIRGIRLDADDTRSYFLPAVLNTPGPTPSALKLQTTIGLVALGGPATFSLTYRDASGTHTATANVAAAKTVEYGNILEQLLGIPAGQFSEGSLLIETAPNGRVYGRLTSVASGASLVSVSQDLLIIGSDSELVTSPLSQRPIYLDGLSQSVDANRGTAWSLILNELSGASGSVIVRLYEAGNRSAAFAENTFNLSAYQTLSLNDLFAAMNLSSGDRLKDRANILMSVTHSTGAATVAAIARSLDKATLSTRAYALAPAGTAPLNVSKVSVVAPPPAASNTRRRGVRH